MRAIVPARLGARVAPYQSRDPPSLCELRRTLSAVARSELGLKSEAGANRAARGGAALSVFAFSVSLLKKKENGTPEDAGPNLRASQTSLRSLRKPSWARRRP